MASIAHREFAIELAHASGEFIRPYFARRDLALDVKTDGTIVTAADRGAEQLMREMINRQFPEHGIIGEEFGAERPDAEYVPDSRVLKCIKTAPPFSLLSVDAKCIVAGATVMGI